jgi:hypothetical protein
MPPAASMAGHTNLAPGTQSLTHTLSLKPHIRAHAPPPPRRQVWEIYAGLWRALLPDAGGGELELPADQAGGGGPGGGVAGLGAAE